MNTTQAKQQGVAAFESGKGRAPALNTAFIAEAAATGNLCALMDAYMHGWTIAMLADGVNDRAMPSVRELAQIKAA